MIMKRIFVFKLLFLVVGIAFLFSCSSEKEPKKTNPTERDLSLEITKEEAIEQAIQLRTLIAGDSFRSTQAIVVQDVQTIGGDSPFRSASELESPVYVVNFENNAGFVILNSRKDGPSVLGVTESGYFDPKKEIENPGFKLTFDAMITSLGLGGFPIYTDLDGPGGKYPSNPIVSYGPWELQETYDPLLNTEWGQDYPYKTKIPMMWSAKDKKMKHPPVGCVATAVAQILAYHKPNNRYPWYSFEENPKPHSYDTLRLQDLFVELGKPYLLNMGYGLKESGADSRNVPRTLKFYDMKSSQLEEADNAYSVVQEVENGRLVYFRGAYKDSYGRRQGHAWVMDGFKKFTRRVIYTKIYPNNVFHSERTETVYLLHCNYGWNGKGNGFYNYGLFTNTPQDKVLNKEEVKGQAYNYDFALIKGIENEKNNNTTAPERSF